MIKTFGLGGYWPGHGPVHPAGLSARKPRRRRGRPVPPWIRACLPPGGWTSRTDLAAAARKPTLAKASVPIGKGVNGQLVHAPAR